MKPIVLQKLASQIKQDGISRVVVAGIIQHNDKYLILKRSSTDFMPGLYELPSGKVKQDEEWLDALLREVKEETNLNVKSIKDFINSFDYQSASGVNTRQLNFCIECESYNSVLLNSNEHEGYAWLTNTELENYNISKETKNAIQIYNVRGSLGGLLQEQLQNAYQENIDRFVVGGIIFNSNKALIVKRAADDFMGGLDELPSGKVDKNEALDQALTREIFEECNLTVKSILTHVGNFDYLSKSGAKTRQFNFIVDITNIADLKLSHEHEGYAWISRSELNRYKISDQTKSILEKSFDCHEMIENSKKFISPFDNSNKRKRSDESSSNCNEESFEQPKKPNITSFNI